MRFRKLLMIGFRGLFILVLVLVFQCSVDRSPKVTIGSGNLGVIEFSQAWTKADPAGGRTVLTVPAEYEIRKIPDSSISELLFAVQSPDGSYSENFYTVSLDGRFTVGTATVDEWNRAERVLKNRQQIPSAPDSNSVNDGVYFRGKTFDKSGESWGVALLSPNENWAALFSYTSEEEPREKTIFSFLGGGEPGGGTIFVDVYDTSSGQKFLAGQAPFSGFGPTILFNLAFWADDHCVVLPLDLLLQTSFLGIP